MSINESSSYSDNISEKVAIENQDMPNHVKNMANAIRFLSADAVQTANSGHPGMPMGMADVATVLFSSHLKYDPSDPNWPDRDRFVLSAGHGSMLLYSLLYLTGYSDMTMDEIKQFRQFGSKTPGHPELGHAGGIETTTGPLGQGLANAVGMALVEKILNARFGDDLVDHFTYVIVGDGCLMEGISHEVISFAGNLGLSKLIVLFDDNSISIDGPTSLAVNDDHKKRFEASGWNVASVDGHDHFSIHNALTLAKESVKPSLISCKTIIGFGAPNKQGTASTHGAPLGEDELLKAKQNLDWPKESFAISDEILLEWRKVGIKGEGQQKKWYSRLKKKNNNVRLKFESAISGNLPPNWEDLILAHKRDLSKKHPIIATRSASGHVLTILTNVIREMIGGSADLTGSVNTKPENIDPISSDNFTGRYIHYGVREHGMAGIMNGMALHGGAIPYGGTFLVFTDYMKGAMRLSALMCQRVIYILTHDSIGLGEDGPTHQAVETLASLRALPNFYVFRPCDSVETAECWSLALKIKDAPSGMVLTRQVIPTQRVVHHDINLCAKGGYILAEADTGQENREATILATGSEVSIAMEARAKLNELNIFVAVASIPCWELFDQQDNAYRQNVLGNVPRVGVEAAVQFGWDKYLREDDEFVGMLGFGASAPSSDLFKYFNITSDRVVSVITNQINNSKELKNGETS